MTAGLVAFSVGVSPAWAGISSGGQDESHLASGGIMPLGIGSGGSGTGGGGTVGPDDDVLYLFDDFTKGQNPTQGWGDDSVNYAIGQIERTYGTLTSQARDVVMQNCQTAVANAINDKSDGPADRTRVVGIAATIKPWGAGQITTWGGLNAPAFTQRYDANWNALGDKGDDLIGHDTRWVNRVNDAFHNQINQIGAAGRVPSNVCVALNNYQPPRDYDLGNLH